MKARQLRALVLAFAFLVSSLVPVRQATAVVPIVGLAIAAIAPTGTVVAADILTAGVTALIGGTIAALALSPSTADAPVRVPLASDQATIDKAMPPPSAPAAATPVAQATGAACTAKLAGLASSGSINGCPVSTTYVSNGDSSFSAGYYSCGYNRVTSSSVAGCEAYNRTYANDGNYQWYAGTPATSCPSGYVQSGSSCVLSNARLAASDNKADLSRSSSGYSSSGDVDALPAYAAVNNNKVVAYGQNSKGEPLIFTTSTSTDGTQTNIQVQTQTTAGGQSAIETRNIAINAATGQVTSASSALNAGSISGVGTGAIATTGSAVSSSDAVFPSDYARAGEAAQAANTIKTSVDQIKDRLTDSAAVADPEAPQYTNHWGDTFTGLLSWSLPAHTSTCPVATFDAFERTFRMDSHCQLASDYWETLRVAMVVVWVILAMFILLRA